MLRERRRQLPLAALGANISGDVSPPNCFSSHGAYAYCFIDPPTDLELLAAQPGIPLPPVLWPDRITKPEDWKTQRAPELRELFQHLEYGHLPPAPAKTEAKVEREEAGVFGGKGNLREVTLTWGMPDVAIHLLVVTPKSVERAPAFLGLAFADPKGALPGGKMEKVWNIEAALDRGYAMALFWNDDVVPDQPEKARERLKLFRPGRACGSAGGR